MKRTDPATIARAVAMRRTHSLKQIADELGVSVGTVKSWMARSGIKLGDNQALRALMTLPPIKANEGTAVVVAPELPLQEAVTGIPDLDAMLWLRAVVATEHPDHIARALEAVKRIKTPAKEIEGAYAMWVRARHGDMAGVFASIGFADLKRHAEEVTRDAAIRAEALARFGTTEALLGESHADRAIAEALSSLDWSHGEANPAEVAELLKARPDLLPMTLADCLHELIYWDSL